MYQSKQNGCIGSKWYFCFGLLNQQRRNTNRATALCLSCPGRQVHTFDCIFPRLRSREKRWVKVSCAFTQHKLQGRILGLYEPDEEATHVKRPYHTCTRRKNKHPLVYTLSCCVSRSRIKGRMCPQFQTWFIQLRMWVSVKQHEEILSVGVKGWGTEKLNVDCERQTEERASMKKHVRILGWTPRGHSHKRKRLSVGAKNDGKKRKDKHRFGNA